MYPAQGPPPNPDSYKESTGTNIFLFDIYDKAALTTGCPYLSSFVFNELSESFKYSRKSMFRKDSESSF